MQSHAEMVGLGCILRVLDLFVLLFLQVATAIVSGESPPYAHVLLSQDLGGFAAGLVQCFLNPALWLSACSVPLVCSQDSENLLMSRDGDVDQRA